MQDVLIKLPNFFVFLFVAARQRTSLIEWINSVLPDTSLSINASDEELRAFLLDGTVLCRILNKLRLGSVTECGASNRSSESRSENVSKFLAAMDQIGLPREQFMPNVGGYNLHNSNSVNNSESDASMKWKRLGERLGNGVGSIQETSPRAYPSAPSGEERRKGGSDSKFQRALRSPVMA
ncbi:hypothetical protein RJ640_002465, partial [Escallonia rubra]